MKYIKQLLTTLVIVICAQVGIWAQCNQEQTITVCDMTTIDFDNDGNPDGIINLYDRTGTTLADGVWSTGLNGAIALDTTTGNLAVWELSEASSPGVNYEFVLSNPTCGDDPFINVTLILGPYSGIALPPDDDDINLYICSTSNLNLSTVLVSNNTIPTAHLNGTWSFTPTSPNIGVLNGTIFRGEVDYQPGLPRVDQNVYELVYTVEGFGPCSSPSETVIKVASVRQVNSGMADNIPICESAILAGDWDQDISLRDYIAGEDIEGYWDVNDDGDPANHTINIRELYNELTDNGNNPRFGCQSYSYTYTVEKRSVVCEDRSTTLSFSIYEELRPFQQSVFPEVCPGKVEDPPTIIELYDFLEFQPGFEYKNVTLTNWEFISGPSDLNLLTKRQFGDFNVEDLRCSQDPAIDDIRLEPPYYSPDGLINIDGAAPGEYRFRYYVCSEIVGCLGNRCPDIETEVVIRIFAEDYAGEDTSGISFCLTDGPIDMRSLLNTNGSDTIVETGIWTDADGNTVNNTFVFPDTISGTQQDFTFTYSTVSVDNCLDDATLSFTIFNEVNAGEDVNVTLCSDDLRITLFNELTGNPDPTGIWTGPFGYTSPDHLGVFNASDPSLPILGPGVYTYTVPGNGGCTSTDDSTVTISIVEPIEIGQDVNETFCILDGRVNLFSLLDRETIRTGVFEDIENTGALTPEGVVEFDLLPNPENLVNPVYNFRYVVPNQAPCDESSLNVAVQVIDLPEPQVPDQQFCILDAKRLDDIEVDVLNYNWYTTLESDTPIVDNPLLFDNDVYYITNVDADNCESERVEVKVDILNTGEKFDNGELCTLDFQDGVSPDGNNQNDSFALFVEDEFNIPVAFPDFELKIYNRYGTQVFKGNANTEEFRGESNTSVRLGDDLPSGTYFYIFTPNFDNNLPIQGSFYLAR